MSNKVCTIDNIKDLSAEYLGAAGFAQAKRDCAADETCKSIVDVSVAFGYEKLGKQFLLCNSGADEVEDSIDGDIYIKGDF